MRDDEAVLLAIDTATSEVIVALGRPDGEVLAVRRFAAERQHGERLLGAVAGLLEDAGRGPGDITGIVVGTGPGAFTGLRVGLATAKTLAHELGLPIAGVSTGLAILAAAGGGSASSEDAVVLLPAGPHDRVEVRSGGPARLLPGGADPAPAARTIAIDLDGRATAAALGDGRAALVDLPGALLKLGGERLRDGGDDVERLVPDYVTLPRGVGDSLDLEGGVTWSHDRP